MEYKVSFRKLTLLLTFLREEEKEERKEKKINS